MWLVGGRFQAPVVAGGSERLTSTYPWERAQTATEIDTVAESRTDSSTRASPFRPQIIALVRLFRELPLSQSHPAGARNQRVR